MDELIQMIEEWSKERGIDKADPQKQMLKILRKSAKFRQQSSETIKMPLETR